MPEFVHAVVQEPRWSDVVYSVPQRLAGALKPGHRIIVPWGKREKRAVAVSLLRKAPAGLPVSKIRPVSALENPEPVTTASSLELAAWISRYYRAPLGLAVRLFLPPEGRDREDILVRLKLWENPVLDLADLAPEAVRLLDYLVEKETRAPGKPIRLSAGRAAGLASVRPAAEELQAHGLAEFESAGPQGKVRPLTETLYVLADVPPEGRSPDELSPLSRKIVETLAAARKPLSRKDLPGSPAAQAQALRKLAAPGLVRTITSVVSRIPQTATAASGEKPPEPSPEQAAAIETVKRAILSRRFAPFLLHGVTGSGKTEVYLRAIEAALEAGSGALVIVPEISLTPQTAERFTARFPGKVAILHSGLGAGERHDEWWRLRRGEALVAVGTRSALFAPVQKPGLIVVDEEHDTSFKQESAPRYHARDTAVKMAQLLGIPVVLGSATPSLDSVENVRQGRYTNLELPRRISGSELPRIQVVSLRREDRDPFDPDRPWFLSAKAEAAIGKTLEAGEQAMVFLNRRGFSPLFQCTSCGHVPQCPHCGISLTYHHQPSLLRCHYCGHEADLPETCGKCSGAEFDPRGLGTEQVELTLKERFPKARTARLDRDAIQRKGALQQILERFRSREIDLLVGTQILAKGHDFPGVTLVVALNADQAMRVPDFRCEERAAQLLAQVAGRAGRGGLPGRVIVQTYEPEHPVIGWLTEPSPAFWDRLLEERRELHYPPSGRLAAVELSGQSEADVFSAGEAIAKAWSLPPSIRLLGPSVPPMARLAGKHRRRFLVKGSSSAAVAKALDTLEQFLSDVSKRHESQVLKRVMIQIDVDPQNLL